MLCKLINQERRFIHLLMGVICKDDCRKIMRGEAIFVVKELKVSLEMARRDLID